MRKVLSFLCVFSLIFTATLSGHSLRAEEGGDLDNLKSLSFLEQLSGGTSTVNSFKKVCDVEGDYLSEPTVEEYNKVCNFMVGNELCAGIEKDDLVDCQDFRHNEANFTTFWWLWNCVSAGLSIIKDLLSFIKDAVLWVFGGPEKWGDTWEEAKEFKESMSNFLAIEYQKEKDKGVSNSKAVLNVAGTVIKSLMDDLGDMIGTNYTRLGCYKPQVRREKICKTVLEITVPPAMAIGLIMKFRKARALKLNKRREFEESERKKRARLKKIEDHPSGKHYLKLISVYDSKKELLKDFEKGTTAFYPGRTIRAFEVTPPKKIAEIFDPKRGGMSRDDFEEMYWSIKSGEIKVTPQQGDFIDDIRHIIDDQGPIFWKEGLSDEVLGNHILTSLRKTDKEWGLALGRDASAVATDKALVLQEKGIIDRALGEHLGRKFENTGFWTGVQNFVFPHYHGVKDIVETNNTLRKRLQLSYKADEPFEHTLSNIAKNPERRADYDFDDNGVAFLETKLGDTAVEVDAVRKDIRAVYDKQLSITDPNRPEDINIRLVSKRIRENERGSGESFEARFSALYDRSNRDLDQLEGKLNSAYRGTREDGGYVPTSDLNDTHLQIRHRKHGERTVARAQTYKSDIYRKTPRNADYRADYEWTVTTHHTRQVQKQRQVRRSRQVSDGNGGQRTEYYTETETYYETETKTTYRTERRSAQIPARVGEVLDNRVTPRESDLPPLPYASPDPAPFGAGWSSSASNGSPSIYAHDTAKVARIMESGREARRIEQPMRTSMRSSESLIDDIQTKYKTQIQNKDEAREGALNQLQSEIDKNITLRDNIRQRLQADQREVTGIWRDDSLNQYKVRNENMLSRVDNMLDRLRYTREQITRNAETLEVPYRTPDHSRDLARLKEIHDKYRRRQMAMGGATAVGGAAVAADVWYGESNPQDYEPMTYQIMDYINKLDENQDLPPLNPE